MGTVKTVERPDRTQLSVATYLPEIARGMLATNRHFWRNLFGHRDAPTRLYPEAFQRKEYVYPERFRGRHRLMQREDGSPRCVACMCCSTACPAHCITIVAGEHPDKEREKYPVRFEIDLLLCIFCGNCVEACPCDAIRMDTGIHPAPGTDRAQFVWRKEDLLKDGGPSIAVQGGTHR
jgi:NADH-quinone oxidoreductase subunit I